jgi:oxygen-dependent protoporphyrinogen oxidase
VVLAVPAFAAAELVRPVSPELSQMLSQVDYVSSATVSLGFRRSDIRGQHDLDGFGFMVPASEDRKIRACTWTSTKFDHRAPDDCVLMRAFVGGHQDARALDADDADIVRTVRDEVRQTMGIAAEPVVSRVYRWPMGNPQYDVGHLDRVSEMERLADETGGLYLTGSAYRGIGTPDCVKSAVSVVEKILGTGG